MSAPVTAHGFNVDLRVTVLLRLFHLKDFKSSGEVKISKIFNKRKAKNERKVRKKKHFQSRIFLILYVLIIL